MDDIDDIICILFRVLGWVLLICIFAALGSATYGILKFAIEIAGNVRLVG